MLEPMRRALEEATSSLDKPSEMPPNPGPVYLLINALAITVATYVASFRMLNVLRAAKEYDARVPALHKTVSGSTTPGDKRSNRLAVVIVALIFLTMMALIVVTAFTLEHPLSRLIFTSIMKFLTALVAFVGYNTVLGLCFPLPKDLSFLRLPIMGHARPFITRPKRARTFRDRAIIMALSVAAIYTTMYPSKWLVCLAVIGLAINSAARMPPSSYSNTLSMRGAVLATTAYFAVIVIASAATIFTVKPRGNEKRDESDIDIDAIFDPSWNAAAVMYQGVFIGALLTALVLRYEHSASTSTSEPQALDDEELAPLAQPEGSAPTVSYSIKEAIAARVTIPNDRPSFSKPLFYVVLAGVFALHIPAIFFSTQFAYNLGFVDREKYPLLGSVAWFTLVLPAQIWTIGLIPALIGVACLVRKDGGALWRYYEVQVKPLAGAPAASEGDGAKNMLEVDKEAKSQLLDEGLSKESPF